MRSAPAVRMHATGANLDASVAIRRRGPTAHVGYCSEATFISQRLSASIERYHFQGVSVGHQDYIDLGNNSCIIMTDMQYAPATQHSVTTKEDIFSASFGLGRSSGGNNENNSIRDNSCVLTHSAAGGTRIGATSGGHYRNVVFACPTRSLARWNLAPILGEMFEENRDDPLVSMIQVALPSVTSDAIWSMFDCAYDGDLRRVFTEAKCIEAICGAVDAWEQSPDGGLAAAGLTQNERRQVLAARDLMALEFYNPLTLAGVARRVGLNRSRLSACFKAMWGTTFYGYLLERRMSEARRLLCQGAPVFEVAASVGYESVGGFSRAFKERFGMAPGFIRPLRA